MSPAWMPCSASGSENSPFGTPKRQPVVTTSIWQLTRSSRATTRIVSTLPPCDVTMTILRRPARATLSPISVHTRCAVSAV